jgi:transposase InsO family protein
VPLRHPYTASKVAELFVDNVYRLHGLPLSLVSDRDPVFTSSFWRSVFRVTGTKLKMSTAHHPQTDGQTERVNQSIEKLKNYVFFSFALHFTFRHSSCRWYNTSRL